MKSQRNILETLNENNIQIIKEETKNYILACPICGKEKVNVEKELGMWKCWSGSCVNAGKQKSFSKLIKQYQENGTPEKKAETKEADIVYSSSSVKEFVENLEDNESAQEWLYETRKFTEKAVEIAEIGCDKYGNITYPHFDAKDKCTLIKTRNIRYAEQKKKFEKKTSGMNKVEIEEAGIKEPNKWYGKGSRGLYGARGSKTPKKFLLLVEGNPDYLTALSMGFKKANVRAVPGCGFRNTEWVDSLDRIEKIYLCYDQDTDGVGQKAAKDMSKRLGMDRCFNVILPANDLNDCWIDDLLDKESMLELMADSDQFDLDIVEKSMAISNSAIERITNPDKYVGISSGITELDEMTKGFRTGELTLVSGYSSAGKTVLARQLNLMFGMRNHPTMYISYETSKEYLLIDMVSSLAGKDARTMKSSEFRDHVSDIDDKPIYWYKSEKEDRGLTFDKFYDYIELCKKRYGLEFLFIDDLEGLIAKTSDKFKKGQENIDKIIHDVRDLAKRLDIHIFAICHLDKEKDTKKKPTKRDLRGGSELQYVPANIILVHRMDEHPDPEVASLVEISVAKVREEGKPGKFKRKYDTETRRYKKSG